MALHTFPPPLPYACCVSLLYVVAVGGNRDVVEPGLESSIKELQPVASHVEYQGVTEEEVLEAKARSHAAEIEQVSEGRGSEGLRKIRQGLIEETQSKECYFLTDMHRAP